MVEELVAAMVAIEENDDVLERLDLDIKATRFE